MSILGAAVLAFAIAPGAQAQDACDRTCLTGYFDAYFTALAANNPSALPLALCGKILISREGGL